MTDITSKEVIEIIKETMRPTQSQLNKFEEKLDNLSGNIHLNNERLERHRKDIDTNTKKNDNLEVKVDKIEVKVDKNKDNIDKLMTALVKNDELTKSNHELLIQHNTRFDSIDGLAKETNDNVKTFIETEYGKKDRFNFWLMTLSLGAGITFLIGNILRMIIAYLGG